MRMRGIVPVAAAAALATVVTATSAQAGDQPISFQGTVPASQIATELAKQVTPIRDQAGGLVNTPPGNSGYIDPGSFARAQASGACADQNPHFCDWEQSYREYQFRDGSLYDLAHPGPNDTATSPRPGAVIISTPDGVPHIFGTAAEGHTAEENMSYAGGVYP